MIPSRAVSALLLHRRRRVVVRHAVNYGFAGALFLHEAQNIPKSESPGISP